MRKVRISKHSQAVIRDIAVKHQCSIEDALHRLLDTEYAEPTGPVCMPSIRPDQRAEITVQTYSTYDTTHKAASLRILPATATSITTGLIEALTHGKRTVKEDTYGIADVLIEANKDSAD